MRHLLTAIVLTFALVSCTQEVEKSDETDVVVAENVYDEEYFLTTTDSVATGDALDITYIAATLRARLNIDSMDDLPSGSSWGFVYSNKTDEPTLDNATKIQSKVRSKIYTAAATGLIMGEKYYYRAYLQVGINKKLFLGKVYSFTTPQCSVYATGTTDLSCFSVTLHGKSYINLYDSRFTGTCGVLYTARQTDTPNATVDKFVAGTATTEDSTCFTATLTDLTPGTQYVYQMCIKIDTAYYLSTAAKFTTDDLKISDTDLYVDLGLSKKWATRNVGADSPELAGTYFAWGDPTGEMTSMNISDYPNQSTIIGTSYDMATQNMGVGWQMPSYDEMLELKNSCTWQWTTYNGVQGYVVESKTNGNQLFLPAAGYAQLSKNGRQVVGNGSSPIGFYWTGERHDTYSNYAYNLIFEQDKIYAIDYHYYQRYEGFTVRAVLSN